MQRYDRQTRLKDFGPEKQALLQQGAVLVIGAGGLGTPVLQYLTAMGIGRIGIVEHDTVSITNLQRQVLYDTRDAGKSKLTVAVNKLKALNPEVRFDAWDTFILPHNALEIISQYDVVVDCSDNFGTRYLVNDACVMAGKPLVYGAIYQYEGQVSVFNFKGSATYRCLFPDAPGEGERLDCNELGVLGILPGIVGSYMTNEVVKIVCGIGLPLTNQLLTIHILQNDHQLFHFGPVPANLQIKALQASYNQGACEAPPTLQSLDVEELARWRQEGRKFQLLDVREPDEWAICHIEGAVHIPMHFVVPQLARLSANEPVAVLCHHGMRSQMVAQQLLKAGFREVYNVTGGFMPGRCW
ncbi:HesA/MoeB/ThiF family protein [Chitinophaga sedimenti]|uniref:HesA/MoeB/ThiF family protein n=1 Tax=Chitinophaga sedimenti TaxID=2033606 RepID=UPI00200445CA|nr:HesA/MoeB/ThiF family protein [Chitinophaga sedimenti]MCK7559121.1 HesA/MoeB/ThiF family protein [Chitinophaga sedimenti]